MRTHLASANARFAATIIAALGLGSLAACGSDVEKTDDESSGSGGRDDGSGGGSTGSLQPTSSTGGGSYPDHPPTCEELTAGATGSGQSGTGVGGGGTGGGELYARECESPEDVLVGCLDTGVDRCANGFFTRPEAVACPQWHRPPSEFSCTATELADCANDGACGAGAICDQYFAGPPAGDGCQCVPTCESDDDCASNELCLCGDGGGRCVASSCRTDSDCGPGLHCASMSTGGCNATLEFHCQSNEDACIEASDCPSDGMGDVGCVVDESGARACETGFGCMAAGRPLVVEGELRFAPAARRRDWARGLEVVMSDEAVRADVAARWAHVGAMEHASVASFARFALDLLAFGAPPELVAGASSAMLDETEHARLAYGLASAYAVSPVGPGRLDVGGARPATDIVELAVATFLEGCIAEGAAAAEAVVAASTARDPAVVAVLDRIAREEATHAELGWKTIAWALERDARVAPALRAALETALARRAPTETEPGLEAFGLLGPAEREIIRTETLRSVVRPVLARLLSAHASRETAAPLSA
jgi:hypothetical protein